MSATHIDFSPIANSIRTLGAGLASNALKKAQLDRQYASDMVAFDKAQSDMALNAARQATEEQQLAWKKELAAGYNPELFSPQQQATIGVNTMAGRNVVSDAIEAAGKMLEQAGGGAKTPKLSPSVVRMFFNDEPIIDPVSSLPVTDRNGAPQYKLNQKKLHEAMADAERRGVAFDDPFIWKYMGGMLPPLQQVVQSQQGVVPQQSATGVMPQQAVTGTAPAQSVSPAVDTSPQMGGFFGALGRWLGDLAGSNDTVASKALKPGQTNLPTGKATEPTVSGTGIEREKETIRQLLWAKKISLEDAIAMSRSLGITH